MNPAFLGTIANQGIRLPFNGQSMTDVAIFDTVLVRSDYTGPCCEVDILGTPTDVAFADMATVAANDYELLTIYDQSGNGTHLTGLHGTPTLSINPYNGKPGFYCPTGAVLTNAGYTDWNGLANWNMFVASKVITNPSGYLMSSTISGAVARFLYKAGGNSNRFTQFQSFYGGTSEYYATARYAGELDRIQYDGGAGTAATQVQMYQNTLLETRDTGGSHETTFTAQTGICINGDSAGFNTLDRFYHAIYLIGQDMATKWVAAINAHLNANYFNLPASQLIPIGDSLTFGIGTTLPPTDPETYPAKLQVLLEALTGTTWNTSIGSNFSESAADTERVLQMAEGAGTAFDLIDVHYRNTVLIAWAGTNDFAIDGDSAAATLTSSLAIVTPANLRGASCWYLNMLPRQDLGGGNAAFEAKRLTYNAGIVATMGSTATVIDVAGVPQLADPTDTNYYDGDTVHLNPNGYEVVAETVFAALEPTLNL